MTGGHDAVAGIGEGVEAVVELVVVRQRVNLRLRVADLVGFHLGHDGTRGVVMVWESVQVTGQVLFNLSLGF